ncbi:NADP-dependent oxidoreductase [bacterium]|nr:NADP-dependent oxidoreductase [bacterium]
MSVKSKEVRLKQYPVGLPKADDFEFATVELPEIGEKEVLVRNLWLSVDPYMRGRMTTRKSYVPPFQIGAVMEGGAIGRVEKSNHPDYGVGEWISSFNGWREFFVSTGEGLTKIPDKPLAPEEYLGAAGLTGFTAYSGLIRIAEVKKGDAVFVSAASGAVGSMVCQIAKLKGCYVVGSVGSKEKAEWLTGELGVDSVIHYREEKDLSAALAKACPQGVDVYFENVGGKHLEAALNSMNDFGRIALCGMIDRYNDTSLVPGPNNLGLAVSKRLRLQGFIVTDHVADSETFLKEMTSWIQAGAIKTRKTVYNGIEKAPEAFLGLFEGKNIGKMLVKL